MRYRSLARLVEQSLLPQLRQRQLHRLSPEAVAFGIDARDLELQSPTGGEHGHRAEEHYLHPIVGRCRHPVLIGEPHHTGNLRGAIAKGEIPMAVAVTLEVADFAADPNASHF